MVHRVLAASVMGLALGGCPLLEVEAEVPSVCVTYRDLAVEGLPGPALTTSFATSFAIDDLSAFDRLTALDAELEFVSATVTATRGLSDLAFVEAASVSIASGDPASELGRRTIYACEGDCPTRDTMLTIPVADQQDALAYVRSGSLLIDVELQGELPTQAWSMDVEVCMRGAAAYSLGL